MYKIKKVHPFFIILLSCSYIIGQDKGLESFKNGNYDEAKKYYEKVLIKENDNNGAKFGLATTLYEQDKKEIASSYLQSVFSTKDKELASKAFFNYANILREEGRVDESLEFYKKAILSDNNNGDAKINYEILKDQQNQDQQNQDQQNQDQQNQDQQNQDQQNQDQQNQDQQNQDQQNQDQQNQDQQNQDQQNQDQQNQINRTKINRTKINRTKINRTKINRTKINRTKINRTKINRIKINRTKINRTKINRTKINRTKINRIKINRIKINRTKINLIKFKREQS